MSKAKIVCTIGPASSDPAIIRQLVESGMDVARLNFSHGSHESHTALRQALRQISQELGVPLAVLQDLQGPRIRLGTLESGQALLVKGQHFELHSQPIVGNSERASVSYAELPLDMEPGETILIRDGQIRLRVDRVQPGVLETTVEVGGIIADRSGLNLPDTRLRLPAITAKDVRDIEWGLAHGVDYFALSFVSSVLDIHQLKSRLPKQGHRPMIIAKIERPRAVEIIPELLAAADGVMVARGDLGVELPREKVPLIQKEIIRLANQRGKIVITATQMLESMIQSPVPTRAEASDVANAVLDGSDAVMLSGETAAGSYPVEAVRVMERIIREVEQSALYRSRPDSSYQVQLPSFSNAVALAATAAADELNAVAICALTTTGKTAQLLMAHRPDREIFAFTPSVHTYNRMALYWGVMPILEEECTDIGVLVSRVEQTLREQGRGAQGQAVVLVMGVPLGTGAETNLIKLHRLGDPIAGFTR
ncbi:MAG: pyruvate kinase [Bradymonadales bacterium]|nr:pyruvate kinase [Bradymonadales bacterium]